MPSPGELLSRGFSMGGKVKNAELAAIAAGINASGHYSRRGNNRRTNEAKAQAMLKWYTNSEAKGKEGGKAFQTRRNFARNLAAALAVSPSGSRASSRGNNNLEKVFLAAGKPAASRKASRPAASPSKKPSPTRKGSRNGVPQLNFHGPGGANIHGLSYKEKYPPAQGTWPMLKKDGHVWQIKVFPGKGNTAFVSKLWGKVGGKMEASQKLVKGGRAGRSAQQEATHEAELAHEKKKEDDGYTEVRSIHRGSNNKLKSLESINNFVVGK